MLEGGIHICGALVQSQMRMKAVSMSMDIIPIRMGVQKTFVLNATP